MSQSNNRFGQPKPGESNVNDVNDRMKKGTEQMKDDMSDMADSAKRQAGEVADTVSTKLKSAGIDTEVMVDAAKDRAAEWQRLLSEELQARPMRALGIAAAVGVFVGLMTR
jgi:ElaB/YqjD/DUF883 family membrane-anchored ribosome-binding protein